MLVGHKIQREFLKKSFEISRVSHAYLFSGVDGLGKKAVALEFIRMINNQGKDLSKSQPDLIMIEPQQGAIQISQIREMQKALSLRPFSAPFKAAIIDEAEKMTAQAQNCLLKTLEEPKGQAVLILISSKPEMLLETVRSRTQLLKFYPVPSEEMRTFLEPKISSPELEKLIFVSEGRPGKAIGFLQNPQRLRVWWQMFEDIQNLVGSNLSSRFKYLDDFFKEKSPENLEEFLDIFLRYFRLVLLSKLGLTRGFNKSYSLEKIKEIIKQGEKIKFLISQTNINRKLALETLFLSV